MTMHELLTGRQQTATLARADLFQLRWFET